MAKKKISTLEWEELANSIKGAHAKKFNAILSTLDDVEFMNQYLKVLEYVQPKIQRQEIVDETPTEDKVIRIEYVESESDRENEDKG